MNVSLTPELEKYIASKVHEGKYQTASEVVREALRLMSQTEELRAAELDRLRKEVQIGLDQIARGEVTTFNLSKIKSQGRKRLARKMKRVG